MSSMPPQPQPSEEASVTPSVAENGAVFLTLDETGVIVDWDDPVETMFGYSPRDLIFRHISKLIPRLLYMELIQGGQINSRLHYLCHIGLPFLVQPDQGKQFQGFLSLTDLGNPLERRVRLGIQRR